MESANSSTAGITNFTYDNEGQLSDKNGTAYTFDYAHRLVSIGGTTYQYKYDGGGNRLEAVRNGTITRYIYDANRDVLAEADENNIIKKYYIYGAGLLAVVTDTGDYYCYHFNGIGSTVAMTDASENVVNQYSYTPFGTIADQQETLAQPFKFVGQYGVMSEDNGLYYMRARYYAPEVGRFISEDPIGFKGGINLYVYVGNNSVNYIDPNGLKVYFLGGSFGEFLGVGAGLDKGLYFDSENWDIGTFTTHHYGVGVDASAGITYGQVNNRSDFESTATTYTGGLGSASLSLMYNDENSQPIGSSLNLTLGTPVTATRTTSFTDTFSFTGFNETSRCGK